MDKSESVRWPELDIRFFLDEIGNIDTREGYVLSIVRHLPHCHPVSHACIPLPGSFEKDHAHPDVEELVKSWAHQEARINIGQHVHQFVEFNNASWYVTILPLTK